MGRYDKKPNDRYSGLTFTGRITLLFGLVSVMTAIIAAIVLAFVWENHFREYALENMQSIAKLEAVALANSYEDNGGWTKMTFTVERVSSDETIGIQGVDLEGNLVYGDNLSVIGGTGFGSRAIQPTTTVSAEIVVEDNVVGTVNVWTIGNSYLLTQRDMVFKENSYGAVLFATCVAVFISCLIGYAVARGLVTPIKRITRTANAIKGGDLTARTGLLGNDEIAQLGMTFDDMAQSIENDRELELRLTNDVAHELRTPLMAMQATMEAMVDGVLPADEQRLLMLNNEVIRLGKLVDALLKLSRLENRSTPVKLEELDLGELIEELVLSHQMLVEESGLGFEYTYEPGIMVMADPDLIKQAAANILSNSVRYTPAGGKVSIEVSRSAEMAKIAISDTGIGLSEEDLQHIFSRFWRADSGRDRASGGLGVGLAIVKEIVDRHNGWVNVESEVDVGSTFTINIPLVEEDPRKGGKKKQDKQGGRALTRRWLRFPATGEHVKDDSSKKDKAKRERDHEKGKQAESKREGVWRWGPRKDTSRHRAPDDTLSDILIEVSENERDEE